MSRYIDAEKLHDEVDMFCRNVRNEKIHKSGIHAMIENIKTADAVDVVRCCDCKYNNSCLLQSFVEENSMIPFDRNEWFCPDGESGV